MRFHLVLKPLNRKCILPVNYQYALSSWIYKVIQNADEEYSMFLHKVGYKTGSKSFRHFTFSPLFIKPFKIHKETEQIEILGNEVSLKVSFYPGQAAESYIKGLFQDQKFEICDNRSGVDFEVTQVETTAPPDFEKEMRYKLYSPMVLSRNGQERHAQYMQPDDEHYETFLLKNLWNKYLSISDDQENMPDTENEQFYLKTLSKPRQKLITIKKDTPQQTKIRGYVYDFVLRAPEPLHEIGYFTGFGEKGSMGFGFGEVVSG